MKYKLPKRIYFSLLLDGAKLFEYPQLATLNQMVATLYSRVLPTILKNILRLRFQLGQLDVIARHSSKDRVRFNIFLSDLDLSLVLDKNDLDKSKKIVSYLLKFKAIFPFLGEIEIYCREGYQNLNQWRVSYGELYNSFRLLRKIRWLEIDLKKTSEPYQVYKASRALSICYEKLNIKGKIPLRENNYQQLNEEVMALIQPYMLNHHMADDTASIASDIQFDYFQCVISNHPEFAALNSEDPSLPLLQLSNHAALTLLALCPQTYFHAPELESKVRKYRAKSQGLSLAWRGICEIEYAILTAVVRGSPFEQAWMKPGLSTVKLAKDEASLP